MINQVNRPIHSVLHLSVQEFRGRLTRFAMSSSSSSVHLKNLQRFSASRTPQRKNLRSLFNPGFLCKHSILQNVKFFTFSVLFIGRITRFEKRT